MTEPSPAAPPPENLAARVRRGLRGRPVVLVGMMGCGKSTVGRRLAARLHLPFVDADHEIEIAAGLTVPEIFATHGESYFRDGERRVIARILASGPGVLATGGGAYINHLTRAEIARIGLCVWLKAEPQILFERVKRRPGRPLLQTADPEGTLRRLLAEREPFYGLADVIIESREAPHEAIVGDVLAGLDRHLAGEGATAVGATPDDASAGDEAKTLTDAHAETLVRAPS